MCGSACPSLFAYRPWGVACRASLFSANRKFSLSMSLRTPSRIACTRTKPIHAVSSQEAFTTAETTPPTLNPSSLSPKEWVQFACDFQGRGDWSDSSAAQYSTVRSMRTAVNEPKGTDWSRHIRSIYSSFATGTRANTKRAKTPPQPCFSDKTRISRI